MFRHSLRCLLWATSGFVMATSAGAQDVLNGIAAEVAMGGEKDVVTFSQVRVLIENKERLAKQTLQGEVMVEKIKEIRLAAINDLVDRALILQEFKLKGYSIPPYLLDERVQDVIRDSFGGDRQAFLRTLSAQGLTLEKFRDFQRETYIVQEMRREAIKGATTVSEQSVREYYKAHADDYRIPEQAKLRMIVLRGEPGSKSPRPAMDEIREKIVQGADFGEMARVYDQGGAQDTSGDLGWVDRQQFEEGLTKVAFDLKPGEMSPVIERNGSCYLILSEAKKPAGMKPLEEVQSEIEKTILATERQKQQQDWLLKLRKKAYIKLY